jgi:hypothetical protein
MIFQHLGKKEKKIKDWIITSGDTIRLAKSRAG